MSYNRSVSDTVQRKRRRVLLVGEIKSETAVDDTESDDNASEPDVSMRPEGAALVLLEKTMVHITKNRLEEDQDEKHNADDWMSLIELLESEQGQHHVFSRIDVPCGSVWQDKYRFRMPQ